MPQRTRDIAEEIVLGLQRELGRPSSDDLPGIRSLFVYGSFVRGDWLECNCDLDLGVLFSPEAPENSSGWERIQDVARRILAGRDFPSHTPGAIDWSTLSSFPTRDEEARKISGFFPFNIFLFDFQRHVPDFPMKADGDRLIRQYLQAVYPKGRPQTRPPAHYQGLILALREVVGNTS